MKKWFRSLMVRLTARTFEKGEAGQVQLLGYLSVDLGLANSAEWNVLTAETLKGR